MIMNNWQVEETDWFNLQDGGMNGHDLVMKFRSKEALKLKTKENCCANAKPVEVANDDEEEYWLWGMEAQTARCLLHLCIYLHVQLHVYILHVLLWGFIFVLSLNSFL